MVTYKYVLKTGTIKPLEWNVF